MIKRKGGVFKRKGHHEKGRKSGLGFDKVAGDDFVGVGVGSCGLL